MCRSTNFEVDLERNTPLDASRTDGNNAPSYVHYDPKLVELALMQARARQMGCDDVSKAAAVKMAGPNFREGPVLG